jgi:hypothetical protein
LTDYYHSASIVRMPLVMTSHWLYTHDSNSRCFDNTLLLFLNYYWHQLSQYQASKQKCWYAITLWKIMKMNFINWTYRKYLLLESTARAQNIQILY